jgi:hypothetical protein
MNDIALILLALVGSFFFVGLAVFIGNWSGKRRAALWKDYLSKTDICPTCFGRGRVTKKGYEFVEDPYKREYETERRLKDIPEPFRKAFKEKK